MAIVRFINVPKAEGKVPFGTRDESFPTKTEAIVAIRARGAKPGPKVLDGGKVVRIAYLP